MGGINTSVKNLNTLNGTSSSYNNDLLYFSDYDGKNKNFGLVDFTYTGLQVIKICYAFLTIKVPSSFTTFDAGECAQTFIDYTNITSATSYSAYQVNSTNYSNFNGYGYINCSYDASSIIGSNTTEFHFGGIDRGYGVILNQDWDAVCTKATNLKALVANNSNLSELSTIQTLSCTSVTIKNGNVDGITLTKGSNLATSLESLSLTGNKIVDLTGLKYAENLTTLDLSDNLLQNTFTYLEDDETSENYGKNVTVKTCDYLASLPNLKTVTLDGNDSLTDYTGLINAGFKQSGTVFTKE